MSLKYRRTGNTLITVIDGNILGIEYPDNIINEKAEKLKELIDDYNSESGDDALQLKAEIINLMLPPKKKIDIDKSTVKDQNELAEIETYENAFENIEDSKRIADISDTFEYDENGRVYLAGFSVPIPNQLAEALLDAKYNGESKYTVDSLVNFWKWALLNPNQKARVDLFKWFDTGKFVITEEGFVLAYRNVNVKKKGLKKKLIEFLSKSYIKVKGQRQSPKNYAVIQIEKKKWKLEFLKRKPEAVNYENYVGNLAELYADINTDEDCTVYTDNHTGTMEIKLGEEVSMPREDCDENHEAQCSRGLHFMSPSYGLRLGSTTIVVLINPYNIVAFPSYDNTKGRTCAYMPMGIAEKKDGQIVELDSGTYDFDYSGYTSESLNEILNGGSLQSLKDAKLIANDITEKDFSLVKDSISQIIQERIVNV